jgi:hypothetical protein
MTEKKINTQFPVIFQKLEEFEEDDLRFVKVRIWLMHTELNLNGSFFSKEVVEKAIPTLANTPLLSFIEENNEGEQDFSDHRMVLHKSEDGDLSTKYIGSAVGTIPESNNAHWEMRVTDSGEEKEYLVVDALMWTKWGDPTDIMIRKGISSQSMELSSDYSGTFDKDGVFHFETFSFFGACLLGDGVTPAMQNSTVEIQFSENNAIQKSIENKLQEFYTLFSQQGGTKMEEKSKVEEVLQVGQETFNEDGSVVLEGTIETPEVFEVETTKATEVATQETFEVETEEEEEIQPTQEFALTANQLRDQLRAELGKEHYHDTWGDKCRKYYLIDNTDALVIFENTQENYQLYAAPFTLNGDNVELNLADAYKVKVEYVAFEANQELFAINSERFSVEQATLQAELKDLVEYKRTREEDDIKAKFADKLSEQEFTEVFEKMKESTIEDVEDKLFALYGKKNFTATKPVTQVNKVSFSLPKEENEEFNPYGDIFEK